METKKTDPKTIGIILTHTTIFSIADIGLSSQGCMEYSGKSQIMRHSSVVRIKKY